MTRTTTRTTMMKRAVVLLLLAGCPHDSTEIGPVLHLELDSRLSHITDENPGNIVLSSSETEYTLNAFINFEAGVERTSKDQTLPPSFVPKHFTLTMDPIGVMQTEADYTPHEVLDDRRYDNGPPITIPKSAKGSMVTVHMEGVDSRGLDANIIDFSFGLN